MDIRETRRMPDGTEYLLIDTTSWAVHYLIEHPTRGCYASFGNSRSTGEWVPQFKNGDAIHRNSPEVWHTPELRHAEVELAKVLRKAPQAYIVRVARPRTRR